MERETINWLVAGIIDVIIMVANEGGKVRDRCVKKSPRNDQRALQFYSVIKE